MFQAPLIGPQPHREHLNTDTGTNSDGRGALLSSFLWPTVVVRRRGVGAAGGVVVGSSAAAAVVVVRAPTTTASSSSFAATTTTTTASSSSSPGAIAALARVQDYCCGRRCRLHALVIFGRPALAAVLE